jgi:hypothetical protein
MIAQAQDSGGNRFGDALRMAPLLKNLDKLIKADLPT